MSEFMMSSLMTLRMTKMIRMSLLHLPRYNIKTVHVLRLVASETLDIKTE